MSLKLLKKLIFRLDGAADSAKTRFRGESGATWEAEFSLHSGTTVQSPRLLIIFRNLSEPKAPQRYTLAPPRASKVPAECVGQMDEASLRELLSRSVKV
ncbi:MAG: hypothetical protein ACE5HP_08555 [Gemmatimonadota bacterium]